MDTCPTMCTERAQGTRQKWSDDITLPPLVGGFAFLPLPCPVEVWIAIFGSPASLCVSEAARLNDFPRPHLTFRRWLQPWNRQQVTGCHKCRAQLLAGIDLVTTFLLWKTNHLESTFWKYTQRGLFVFGKYKHGRTIRNQSRIKTKRLYPDWTLVFTLNLS